MTVFSEVLMDTGPIPVPTETIDERRLDVVQVPTFSWRITTEQLRRQRIARSRNWFAGLCAFFVVAAILCFHWSLPYEPFVAALIAAAGSAVVLAMKAAGR
jgi:hypothetical protein